MRVTAVMLTLVAACGSAERDLGTLEDMEFLGYVDRDGDGQTADDDPVTVRLSDYLAGNRPGTRILMINAAAGWCDPCMREAAALKAFAAEYGPRGVAVVTAVFQDGAGAPADRAFGQAWAETFGLATPVLVDSSFQLGRYFDAGAMPANLFVDAESGRILTVATGAQTGADPLRDYRELLDEALR